MPRYDQTRGRTHHTPVLSRGLPRFDTGDSEGGCIARRGVPAIRVGDQLVTTVFDLLMSQYAVPRAGRPVGEYIVDELASGRLRWAAADPDAPENWPRVMTIWRANVLGSSGKGMEYFMRHLLGSEDAVRGTHLVRGHPGPAARGIQRSGAGQ